MPKSKKERFIEVATFRTNKILDDMRLLGNCSNRNNYDYSEREAKEMLITIENELKLLRNKFLLKKSDIKKFSFSKKELWHG